MWKGRKRRWWRRLDKSLSTDRIKWQSFVIKTRQKEDEREWCVRKQQQPPPLPHKGSLILIQDKSSIKASEKESADGQGMISSGMAHTNAALIIIVCPITVNQRFAAISLPKLLSLGQETLCWCLRVSVGWLLMGAERVNLNAAKSSAPMLGRFNHIKKST